MISDYTLSDVVPSDNRASTSMTVMIFSVLVLTGAVSTGLLATNGSVDSNPIEDVEVDVLLGDEDVDLFGFTSVFADGGSYDQAFENPQENSDALKEDFEEYASATEGVSFSLYSEESDTDIEFELDFTGEGEVESFEFDAGDWNMITEEEAEEIIEENCEISLSDFDEESFEDRGEVESFIEENCEVE